MEGGNKAIVVGPWGGHGGTYWDDGCFDGIREITLTHARCIDSICVVYDKNGKPMPGEKRGGTGGLKTEKIVLKFPDEVLTCMSGHYSPVVHGGSPVIRSLTFKSNERTFGPYGVEDGIPFYFPMEGGQIIGLKGRCGWYLDAIGIHITQIVKAPKPIQNVQQRFKRFTSSISFAPFRELDQAGRTKSAFRA